MKSFGFGRRYVLSGCVAAAMLAGCGRSQPPIGAPGAMPQDGSTIGIRADRGGSMREAESAKPSFLYVASLFFELSKFTLDGSKPLRTVRLRNSNGFQGLAVNPQGYLFVESGNLSEGTISVYDARTLRAVREIGGTYVPWLVSGPGGYVYGANCGDAIYVIAPEGTGVVGFVTDHVVGACKLAFDPSGDLFVENQHSIAIYTPIGTSGQWQFTRELKKGIRHPNALGFDRLGHLYVADAPLHKSGSVAVFSPGNSSPYRVITSGIAAPAALATDSMLRLFVANDPFSVRHGFLRGWVSVYSPTSNEPVRKLQESIDEPTALAVSSANELYVANYRGGGVAVYGPAGKQLLHVLTDGVHDPDALAIAQQP
jgi:DNA-binding beta-propeller fold protein YncE